MRVRRLELRLIAVALVVCWSIAAGLVLLAYRPGGPFDLIVGLLAMTPIAIALAGVIWPPVARGDLAFPAIVWLGIASVLCLVPSIAGVVTQLMAFGSRTLLPSFEAAYPWLLASSATSLFCGFGMARRLHGRAARPQAPSASPGRPDRRRRPQPRPGARSGRSRSPTTWPSGTPRSRPRGSGRRPGSGTRRCAPLRSPPARRPSSNLLMSATIDLRPVGTVELSGTRVGRTSAGWPTSRPSANWAGTAPLGRQGYAWSIAPGNRLAGGRPGRRSMATRSTSRRSVSLSPPTSGPRPRTAASRSSKAPGPGAAAVAVDGPDLRRGLPARHLARRRCRPASLARPARLLDLPRRRALGQSRRTVNGEAAEIVAAALNGTIDLLLTATARGRQAVVYPSDPMTIDGDRERYATKRDRLARPRASSRSSAGSSRGHADRRLSPPGWGCRCARSTAT